MIDKNTARRLVLDRVNANYQVEGDELVIIEDATLDRPYGWVFFYTSRKWVETDDVEYAIAGNGPVVVEKVSGEMHLLGTALPPEEYIREFELKRGYAET